MLYRSSEISAVGTLEIRAARNRNFTNSTLRYSMSDAVSLKAKAEMRRHYDKRDDLKEMPMNANKKDVRTGILASEIRPGNFVRSV